MAHARGDGEPGTVEHLVGDLPAAGHHWFLYLDGGEGPHVRNLESPVTLQFAREKFTRHCCSVRRLCGARKKDDCPEQRIPFYEIH